jgi:hypothetical protein
MSQKSLKLQKVCESKVNAKGGKTRVRLPRLFWTFQTFLPKNSPESPKSLTASIHRGHTFHTFQTFMPLFGTCCGSSRAGTLRPSGPFRRNLNADACNIVTGIECLVLAPPPASAMTAAPPRPSTGASAPSWCLCARTSMCMAASVVSPLTTACACVFSAGAPCARAESAALFSSTAPLVSGAGTAALTSFPMARRSCRPSAWPSLARSRGISLLLRPSPALLRPCLEAFACPTLSRGSRTPSIPPQSASGA